MAPTAAATPTETLPADEVSDHSAAKAQKTTKLSIPEDGSDKSADRRSNPIISDDGSDPSAAILSAVAAAHAFLLRHDDELSPRQSLQLEALLASAFLSLRRLSLPAPPPVRVCPWPDRLPPCSRAWDRSFRLSRATFLHLQRLLSPAADAPLLAAALLRLAHAAPYASIARRFALPSPVLAARAFFTALEALTDRSHQFLAPVPEPLSPNCCGFLGFARFGPISVQVLIDFRGQFVEVSAGWPGALHPGAILHQTRLYLGVEESREFLNGPFFGPIPQYVLGDSCFPLLPWLLTPYGAPANKAEMEFNAKHREAMGTVRAAFKRLRRRWRILDMEWKEESMEFLPFVVVACCLLHNFAESSGQEVGDDEDDNRDDHEEEGFGDYEGEVSKSGEQVRDAVAAHLSGECS